jgi:NarL family two-component system response regulator LiaR
MTIRKAPIRVLMADDHPLVRDGIRSLLLTQPDIELAGEATNGAEAVVLAHELAPDVILVDLAMPQMSEPEALIRIVQAAPDARVLVVTSFVEDERLPAIKGRVLDYILKESPPLSLVQAIRDLQPA